jgi:hypothetical protein
MNSKIKEDIRVIQKQMADIKTQVIDIKEDLNGNDSVKGYNPSSSFLPLHYYRKKGIMKEIEEIKNDISLILKYLNVEKKYIYKDEFFVKKPKNNK